MRFTEPHFADVLREHGVPVGQKLGHGAYGIVFAHAAEPDRVVKITTGANEAHTARWLYTHTMFGTSPHVCLPAVHAFFDLARLRVTGYRGDGRVWAFTREALADWPWPVAIFDGVPVTDPAMQEGFRVAYYTLVDSMTMPLSGTDGVEFMDRVDKERHYMRDHWEKIHGPAYAERAHHAFLRAWREMGLTRRNMQDFWYWAKDHDVDLRDLGRENWGVRRDGTVVVRDFGGIRTPA